MPADIRKSRSRAAICFCTFIEGVDFLLNISFNYEDVTNRCDLSEIDTYAFSRGRSGDLRWKYADIQLVIG